MSAITLITEKQKEQYRNIRKSLESANITEETALGDEIRILALVKIIEEIARTLEDLDLNIELDWAVESNA